MPMLSNMETVDTSASRDVFVSAVHLAMSIEVQCPPFGNELKTAAQEQVEYMLGKDKEIPMVMADDEVKSVVRMGISNIFCSFIKELCSLLLDYEPAPDTANGVISQRMSDLEWLCNTLPKMNLMKDFISNWISASGKILEVIEDKRLDQVLWGLKVKLIEVTGKVLEMVGCGNVILPAPCRVQLLKTWLPYVRKMKPILDSKATEENSFPYKMDQDLCQSIEDAFVSLISTLPSNDQADILADWMQSQQILYPDLSEAFEIWCYRTKSANRRLTEGLDRVDNSTTSL